MVDLLYVCRYCQVVSPVPRLMVHAFTAVTAVGLIAILAGHDTTGAPLIPVIVLQAFAASSGFVVPARRGYFDLLITRGASVVRIAVVQWLTSIMPGLCSWAALAAGEVVAHGAGRAAAASTGTALAFLMASTVPWAVTVSLPRFSGAIGWLLVICLSNTGGVAWPDSMRAVVYPLDLVGHPLADRHWVLAADVSISLVSAGAAFWWVNHAALPLEAAQ